MNITSKPFQEIRTLKEIQPSRQFSRQLAQFMIGLAEGLGVRSDEARRLWDMIAEEMSAADRWALLSGGRAEGKQFAAELKKP